MASGGGGENSTLVAMCLGGQVATGHTDDLDDPPRGRGLASLVLAV
jgi:hypothetical protein